MGELVRIDFQASKRVDDMLLANELRELKRPGEVGYAQLLEQAAYTAARLGHAVSVQADELEIQDLQLTAAEALQMINLYDLEAIYKRAGQIQTQLMEQSR